MKKHYLLLIILALNTFISLAQKTDIIKFEDFFSFESNNMMSTEKLYSQNKLYFNQYVFLENKIWFFDIDENCIINKDSIESKHGRYSLNIHPLNNDSIYSFCMNHPFSQFRFKGDSITFSGWYKGKNLTVSDSIYFYIDQADGILVKGKKIPLTKEWSNFNITIPNKHPNRSTEIGVKYEGKSTFLLDDFSFIIDRQSLDQVYPIKQCDLDHEFDNKSDVILPDSLNPIVYSNLETLCKVWGFLKYYHPSVQSGNYNWNYELFRILPDIINCSNKPSLQSVLLNWINSLDITTMDNIEVENKDSILFHPNLNWINKDELGNKLCEKLNSILHLHRSPYNYSVTLFHLNYPIFIEPLYDKVSWKDDGYRLLCLFRYWNIINYFHPYRTLFENDWQKILPDYIHLFADAKSLPDFEKAIYRLAAESKDAHTEIYTPLNNSHMNIGQYEPFQIPLSSKVYKDGVLVTGYWFEETKQCGLQLGDVITSINHKSIRDIRKEKDLFFSFSNENGMIDTNPLLSISQDTALVSYIRKGKQEEIVLKNLFGYYGGVNAGKWVTETPLSSQRIIEKNIAYINPMRFRNNDLRLQLDTLRYFPYMILDLRAYPIDNSIDTILADFLLPDKINYYFSSYSDLSNPGVFRKYDNKYEIGYKNSEYYKGKVIILVDERTMSMGELIALICREASEAKVIGTTTRGVLGNVAYIPFIGGYGTRITGIGVYYPNGQCTYPNGIRLDQEIPMIPQNVYKGENYLIDEVIQSIKNGTL